MRIGEILNPNGQPRLFPLTPAETGLQIDQVRRQFPGSSFVDQLANEAIYQVHHQPHGPPTIETCLKPAIEASYRSISGGIEEHGLQQRGAEVAQFYQNRLAEAWKSLDLPEFLQALLHQETSRPTRPKSRTDLDDGVPL